MVTSRSLALLVSAILLVVAVGAFLLNPVYASIVTGAGATAGVVALLARRGAQHDAPWRRAWGAWGLSAAANSSAAAGYLLVGSHHTLTIAAALVGAFAVAVAGVALLQHRLSRGRAIDVLLEGVLAALAIALSLGAASGALVEVELAVLLWLAVPLVYLAGVWVTVRALALSRDAPTAPRLALMATAGFFATFGLQGVAPLAHLWILPPIAAATVALSCVALVGAVCHPSVNERFSPVPVRSAGLARAHVALLLIAIVAAPLVALVRSVSTGVDTMSFQLAVMVLFPLLVVIHLVRQVQERATGEYRAQHDDLTGLPNRVLFHDRLEVALAQARRQHDGLAVMFVDLDRFKRINDSLGHDVGDSVLREVAGRLRRALREEDTVARLGGDEFAVLLHDVSVSDVQTVGDKLLGLFDAPLAIDDRQLPIGTSIGVALFPSDGDDPDTLLKHADIAMYRAKARLQSNMQFYTAEMSAKAQLRLALESALRAAIENQELAVHYQPRVQAGNHRIVAFEALVRWQHPTLGSISPAAFIPIAEESGLIIEVGNWVLREACRQAQAWRSSGLIDVPVAVNLSARQLVELDVEQTVVDVLRATGLPPTNLELEITESVLMQDVASASDLLQRLRALGIRCAIDDFGTGYSGLSYLAKMPLDTLKIDRSFVAEMTGEGAPIITAVIALARSLDLQVVAEGVETEGQAEALQMLDCDEMQGFLYGRPLPAEGVERMVRRWHARRTTESAETGHLTERIITSVLMAAASDAQPFDDLEAAHAVLAALSDRTPELRALAAAGLLAATPPGPKQPRPGKDGPATVLDWPRAAGYGDN